MAGKVERTYRYVVEKNKGLCLCVKGQKCPCWAYILKEKCVCGVFKQRKLILIATGENCPICPDILKMCIDIGKELNIAVLEYNIDKDEKTRKLLEKIGWSDQLLLSVKHNEDELIPIPQVFYIDKKIHYIADPVLDKEGKIFDEIKKIVKNRILSVMNGVIDNYYDADKSDLLKDLEAIA